MEQIGFEQGLDDGVGQVDSQKEFDKGFVNGLAAGQELGKLAGILAAIRWCEGTRDNDSEPERQDLAERIGRAIVQDDQSEINELKVRINNLLEDTDGHSRGGKQRKGTLVGE